MPEATHGGASSANRSHLILNPRNPQPTQTPSLYQDELAGIAKKSLVSAIQFFCMHCVDETPDELSYKFFQWWNHSSDKYFRTTTSVEAEEDDFHPEAEVEDAGNDVVQAHHLELLQAVQDRAVVMEELQKGPDEATLDAAPPEFEKVPNPEQLLPPDPDCKEGSQPMTLPEIVQKAMAKPAFSKYMVGEEGGVGAYAALQRARLVMGPSREFIRLVRLEEGLLSQALLENRRTDLNPFNLREAELAAARRAASFCAQRTSRAAAWQKATEKFVAGFVEKSPAPDAGLMAVEAFRNLSNENPQIVVFQRQGIDAAPGLGVVLTVFRGCLTKQGGKLVVRTSKPSASDLPVASSRRVHLAVLSAGDRELCFQASCISEVLLLDPVNTIYAEVWRRPWSPKPYTL